MDDGRWSIEAFPTVAGIKIENRQSKIDSRRT
jgi:hypothetical protein